MLRKRSVVGLLCVAILAGCATKPNGDLDDRSCVPDTPNASAFNGDDALVALAAALVIDLTWFAGCEAVVGVTNGIHHFHRAHARDGVYYSPDGAFSVSVPQPGTDEYQVQQQSGDGKDTVLFVPRDAGQPAYGVTVLPDLQDTQASMSLADFSQQSGGGLPDIGGALTQVYAEDIQLGANPARLVVYRSDAGSSASERYYLLYFVKTPHAAAILSITWPDKCPYCATGPESSLREMDPALENFVTSFELSSKGH